MLVHQLSVNQQIYLTSISRFYKNLGDFSCRVSDCEELVGLLKSEVGRYLITIHKLLTQEILRLYIELTKKSPDRHESMLPYH